MTKLSGGCPEQNLHCEGFGPEVANETTLAPGKMASNNI
jgi:hypothetical protein